MGQVVTTGEVRSRDSWFHQAAVVGVAAPVVAIVLGIATQSLMKESPSSAIIIGGVNLVFLFGGFVASIVALVGIGKHGTRGLLVRGVAGLLLNGVFLAAAVALFFLFRGSNVDSRLAGKWSVADGGPVKQQLTLQPDKHFELELVGPGGSGEASGTWRSAWVGKESKFYLVLKPESASAAVKAMNGATIAMPIEEVREDHFTVMDSGHLATYRRER